MHNEILLKGFESFNLLNGLSNHFRNLLLSKNESLVEIMEVSRREVVIVKSLGERERFM